MFKVLKGDDTIFKAKVLQKEGDIYLWSIYNVKLTEGEREGEESKKMEIAPYHYDPKSGEVKFLALAFLRERRRFIRYRTIHLGIEVKGEKLFGLLEDISASGLKIRILEKIGEIKEGEDLEVEVKLPEESYRLDLIVVKATDEFISARFSAGNPNNYAFFQRVLELLKRHRSIHLEERRRYRRYNTSRLNLFAETPFGLAKVLDISLSGMKLKVLRPTNREKKASKNLYLFEVFFLNEPVKYILAGEVLSYQGDTLSVKFAEGQREVYQLMVKILEKLRKGRLSNHL